LFILKREACPNCKEIRLLRFTVKGEFHSFYKKCSCIDQTLKLRTKQAGKKPVGEVNALHFKRKLEL
jgi:hypothetical protein